MWALYHLHIIVDLKNNHLVVLLDLYGVTWKHWPPVHWPPLHTGSMDYLRTGPRTTPTNPSTDHPSNKIKNKNKDFTYCLSNRLLVSAKFCASRWSLLGKCDRPGFSLKRKLCHCRSLHLCHFRCCSFAWKTGKPNRFEISFPLPFCVYVWNSFWQIVKIGTSSRTCGRIGQTKWRRKCTQSSTNFEASWRFPGLSYILIATANKKKWQCGMSMIQVVPKTELRYVTFSQRN